MTNKPFSHQFELFDTSADELECAVAEAVGDAGDVLFSYVAGSVIEGYGTATSDLDIYVVTRESSGKGGGEYAIAGKKRKIEVTLLDSKKLTGSFDKIRAGFTPYCDTGFYDSLLVYRAFNAVPISGADDFRSFLSHYDVNDLRLFLADVAAESASDVYQDALGSLESGDLDTCLMHCCKLVQFGFDGYLAISGNANPMKKWRLRIARQIFGANSEIYKVFLKATICMDIRSDETKEEHIKLCMKLHQFFCDAQCSYYLSGRKNVPAYRSDSIALKQSGDGSVKRSEFAYVHRREERYFLIHRQPIYELNRTALDVWLAAAGLVSPPHQDDIDECLRQWRLRGVVMPEIGASASIGSQ